MSLKIAVQMDPIERINIKGDSTFALLLEAQARGHALSYYTPDRMAQLDGRLFARVEPLTVRDEHGNHFTLGEPEVIDLTTADVAQLGSPAQNLIRRRDLLRGEPAPRPRKKRFARTRQRRSRGDRQAFKNADDEIAGKIGNEKTICAEQAGLRRNDDR